MLFYVSRSIFFEDAISYSIFGRSIMFWESLPSRSIAGNERETSWTLILQSLDISIQERCLTKFALKTGFRQLCISLQASSRFHDDTSLSVPLQSSCYFSYSSFIISLYIDCSTFILNVIKKEMWRDITLNSSVLRANCFWKDYYKEIYIFILKSNLIFKYHISVKCV